MRCDTPSLPLRLWLRPEARDGSCSSRKARSGTMGFSRAASLACQTATARRSSGQVVQGWFLSGEAHAAPRTSSAEDAQRKALRSNAKPEGVRMGDPFRGPGAGHQPHGSLRGTANTSLVLRMRVRTVHRVKPALCHGCMSVVNHAARTARGGCGWPHAKRRT